MRRLLLCVIAASVLAPAAVAQARSSMVQVPVSGPLTIATLERLGFDVTHDVSARSATVLLHSDAERERLAAAGYPSRVLITDVEAEHRQARALDARRGAAAISPLPTGRDTYRYLDDYYAELDALRAAHPGLVRRIDLPRPSVQGRPLAGVEIAADVGRSDDGRPVYVVLGLHHAREWPSGEVNMEFATDLARGYGSDSRITNLLRRVRVIVVPVVNPDGFLTSRGVAPAPAGPDNLQRKNANEVDLNRNYGAFWGGNGASTDPANDTFRGPGPWSEPESAAVHELTRRLHVTNMQSIHNIAALVLRPPGFRALGQAPDEPRLKELGDRMGAVTGYQSQYGYELYEVTGATEDWNYVAQNAFGYTIELGPGGPAPTFQGPYQTHVVQQYLGDDLSPGGGNGVREALLLAGEQAADARDHAVLAGEAPAGATLRLRKAFRTATSRICQPPYAGGSSDCAVTSEPLQLDDGLDTELTVGASGRFEWHVNPSTRPFERKAGHTEAWTLTCETGGRVVAERALTIGLGERREIAPCATDAAGPGAGGPAGAGAGRGVGLSFVLARRQRRSTVLRRGVLVRVTCAADCALGASVRRSRSRARAAAVLGQVLGRRSVKLLAGKRRSLRVRLSSAARRYVRRRGVRRIVLRLEARGAGQRRVAARGVQLVTR
jgi:hypothetical protein